MNRELITRLIESPTEDAIEALFDDKDSVFWVDWREEDDAIVEYCESIIQTGNLTSEVVDADNDAGFEMYINYKDKRAKVPLAIGTEDRHITIVTLNEVLTPDFEVRFCIDSNGADTLAFLPLATGEWRELETQYGESLAKRFYKLQMKPNVFTDPLPF